MNMEAARLAVVTATTLTAATAIFAQEAVDGFGPTTGIVGGLLALGAMMFRYLWCSWRDDQEKFSAERRIDDERREREQEVLRQENRRLHERIEELTNMLINRGHDPEGK